MAVRTQGEPGAFASGFRAAVSELDPQQPVQSIVTMDQLLSRSSAPDRLAAMLLTALAALAVTLAATGIYGLFSYFVARRRREIGLRMALGARRADVLRLVIGDAARITLAGAALGVTLILVLGGSLRGLLFGVGPTDPLSIGSALLLMAGTALLAAWLPARRAAGVDPGRMLRVD